MAERHYTDLCVSQVRVPPEEDGDVVGRLTYLLHDQLQLLHALPSLGLAALQVGGHEAQLLALERHLETEEEPDSVLCSVKALCIQTKLHTDS